MSMHDQPDQYRPESKHRGRILRVVVGCGIGLALLLLAYMFLPILDGMHARVRAKESAAAATLRTLSDLQKRYAASLPAKGFACELRSLQPIAAQNTDFSIPGEFFQTGTRFGYKFSVNSCQTDADGIARHYRLSAMWLESEAPTFRVFCSDESSVIWYSREGSEADCFAVRRQLGMVRRSTEKRSDFARVLGGVEDGRGRPSLDHGSITSTSPSS